MIDCSVVVFANHCHFRLSNPSNLRTHHRSRNRMTPSASCCPSMPKTSIILSPHRRLRHGSGGTGRPVLLDPAAERISPGLAPAGCPVTHSFARAGTGKAWRGKGTNNASGKPLSHSLGFGVLASHILSRLALERGGERKRGRPGMELDHCSIRKAIR
jgi:hypothetical protein